MNRIELKIAEEKDIGHIKQLTDRMLENTGLGLATEKKIRALVLSPKTLFLLAWDGTDLIGYACGVVHESVFNDRLRVTDVGVYVDPEYRSGSVSRKMIDYLEQWAKQQGAEEIWLGQTTGSDHVQVAKYYNRLGYTTKGFNCVKEL
jgi:GNAT superfamily N-acetyltransferase